MKNWKHLMNQIDKQSVGSNSINSSRAELSFYKKKNSQGKYTPLKQSPNNDSKQLGTPKPQFYQQKYIKRSESFTSSNKNSRYSIDSNNPRPKLLVQSKPLKTDYIHEKQMELYIGEFQNINTRRQFFTERSTQSLLKKSFSRSNEKTHQRKYTETDILQNEEYCKYLIRQHAERKNEKIMEVRNKTRKAHNSYRQLYHEFQLYSKNLKHELQKFRKDLMAQESRLKIKQNQAILQEFQQYKASINSFNEQKRILLDSLNKIQ